MAKWIDTVILTEAYLSWPFIIAIFQSHSKLLATLKNNDKPTSTALFRLINKLLYFLPPVAL
jgi:hypothetical protein